jgi:hypothetical protein
MAAAMSGEVPFVVIGYGEQPPWAHLDNSCPICGERDLPLAWTKPPLLSFISHCGQLWARGPLNRDALRKAREAR